MMQYVQALKAFRRGVHVHGPAWKCIVLCDNAAQAQAAFEEALLVLEASSVGVKEHRIAQRALMTTSGARIQAITASVMEAMAGKEVTQVIYIGVPNGEREAFARASLRSPLVPADQCRFDMAEL